MTGTGDWMSMNLMGFLTSMTKKTINGKVIALLLIKNFLMQVLAFLKESVLRVWKQMYCLNANFKVYKIKWL